MVRIRAAMVPAVTDIFGERHREASSSAEVKTVSVRHRRYGRHETRRTYSLSHSRYRPTRELGRSGRNHQFRRRQIEFTNSRPITLRCRPAARSYARQDQPVAANIMPVRRAIALAIILVRVPNRPRVPTQ